MEIDFDELGWWGKKLNQAREKWSIPRRRQLLKSRSVSSPSDPTWVRLPFPLRPSRES